MSDPKLSDFTEDQLQLLLNLVIWDMKDSTYTLAEIYERELASLLRDKVECTEKRIADLRVLTVQIMNAISANKVRSITTSN